MPRQTGQFELGRVAAASVPSGPTTSGMSCGGIPTRSTSALPSVSVAASKARGWDSRCGSGSPAGGPYPGRRACRSPSAGARILDQFDATRRISARITISPEFGWTSPSGL